jgi:hypothetical protein
MNWLQDLKLSLRSLRARPGFALTAVLTLMLGIGGVAAIFTVYDAVLLKPLPFADSARIVRLMREQPPVKYDRFRRRCCANGALAAAPRSMRSERSSNKP